MSNCLFGDYRTIRRMNEIEADAMRRRDTAEEKILRLQQNVAYSRINQQIEQMRRGHAETVRDLHAQIAEYIRMGGHDMGNLSKTFSDLARGGQNRNRGAGRELSGPSLER